MIILKKGNLKEYKFECPECGCVFLAKSSEIDRWYYLGDIGTRRGLKCPCCKDDVYVSELTLSNSEYKHPRKNEVK